MTGDLSRIFTPSQNPTMKRLTTLYDAVTMKNPTWAAPSRTKWDLLHTLTQGSVFGLPGGFLSQVAKATPKVAGPIFWE